MVNISHHMHAVEPLYKGQFRNCKRYAMQWNLSTKDTLGTGRFISTQCQSITYT